MPHISGKNCEYWIQMFEVCEKWVYWNKHLNQDPSVCLDMASYLMSQPNLVFVYKMGIRIFVHTVVCDVTKEP